jgi:glycosyltransferase involved in cell wall biosynthesis
VRIAVYHNLPSGGAKRALYNYTRSLVAAGHEVDAFAPVTAEEGYLDLRPLVGRYHAFPLRIEAGRILGRSPVTAELARYARLRWALPAHAREVAAQIDAGGYDLAFVHHCRYAGSPPLLTLLSTPSVYYCQEPRRGGNEYSIRHGAERPSPAGRLAQRAHLAAFGALLDGRDVAAARAATMVLANSVFSIEAIKRAYGRYARLAYLGADLAAFHPPGAAARRERRVMSVGAMHPSKGHRFALEAVACVPAAARPALHVVADRGEAGYAEALVRRAEQLGVELVVHREVSEADLVELYGRSRAVICAAELEPFGFTPLEGMACGTPAVAVREGGYKETVVDGANGRLTERDPRALGAALARLLADPAEWERLHRGALATAAQWTLERAHVTLEARFAELRSRG